MMEETGNADSFHLSTVDRTEEERNEEDQRSLIEELLEYGENRATDTDIQEYLEDIHSIISKDMQNTEKISVSKGLEIPEHNSKDDGVEFQRVSMDGNPYGPLMERKSRAAIVRSQTMTSKASTCSADPQASLLATSKNFLKNVIPNLQQKRSKSMEKVQPYLISSNEFPYQHKSHNLSVLDLIIKLSYCPVCNSQYTEYNLAQMCVSNHGKKQCWLCLDTVSKSGFRKHCKKFHCVNSESDSVQCPYCGNFFELHTGINHHLMMTHFYEAIEEFRMNHTNFITRGLPEQQGTAMFNTYQPPHQTNQQFIPPPDIAMNQSNMYCIFHAPTQPEWHTVSDPEVFEGNLRTNALSSPSKSHFTFQEMPVSQAHSFCSSAPDYSNATNLTTDIVAQGQPFVEWNIMPSEIYERTIEAVENPGFCPEQRNYEICSTDSDNMEGEEATGDPKFPKEDFSPQDISLSLNSSNTNYVSESPQQYQHVECSDSSLLAMEEHLQPECKDELDAALKKAGLDCIIQPYISPSSEPTNDYVATCSNGKEISDRQVIDAGSTTAKLGLKSHQNVETSKASVDPKYSGVLGFKRRILKQAMMDEIFSRKRKAEFKVPPSHALVHDLNAGTLGLCSPTIRKVSQLERVVRPNAETLTTDFLEQIIENQTAPMSATGFESSNIQTGELPHFSWNENALPNCMYEESNQWIQESSSFTRNDYRGIEQENDNRIFPENLKIDNSISFTNDNQSISLRQQLFQPPSEISDLQFTGQESCIDQ